MLSRKTPAAGRRGRRVNVLLALLMALGIAGAFTGTASATAMKPAYSSSSYVVASVPLHNVTTGEAEWSYGYVQLWYDPTTGDNWTRVVSLLSDTTVNCAFIARANPWLQESGGACTIQYSTVVGSVYLSPEVYSPVSKADAMADVTANGVNYYGETGWY